jgi:hypothetical protein
MRRRLLDAFNILGIAALAAILSGVFSHAVPLIIPHNFSPGQTLPAQFLNDNNAAIVAVIDNLDDSNIRTGAGINGQKLADAPNGITTSKINDLQVTGAKLAAGAAVHATVDIAPTPSLSIGITETAVVTLPPITTRGGEVILFGNISWTVSSSPSVAAVVVERVRRDGVEISAAQLPVSAIGTTSYVLPLPTPSAGDTPPPGVHVYTVTVQAISFGTAVVTTPPAGTGLYIATELS